MGEEGVGVGEEGVGVGEEENSSLFFFLTLRVRSRALASLASSPMFLKRTKRNIKQRLFTGYRNYYPRR